MKAGAAIVLGLGTLLGGGLLWSSYHSKKTPVAPTGPGHQLIAGNNYSATALVSYPGAGSDARDWRGLGPDPIAQKILQNIQSEFAKYGASINNIEDVVTTGELNTLLTTIMFGASENNFLPESTPTLKITAFQDLGGEPRVA